MLMMSLDRNLLELKSLTLVDDCFPGTSPIIARARKLPLRFKEKVTEGMLEAFGDFIEDAD
jgi:hypothetical protein